MNNGRIFEDKLQQGKCGNVIKTDFKIMQHRLLSIIVNFSCNCISQGSVVTQLTCDRMFNNHFIANCPQNALVKIFLNRLIFGKNMDPQM